MLDESTCEEQLNAYTLDDWEPLLELIPQIEATSKFGEWKGGEKLEDGAYSIPWCMHSPVVDKFLQALHSIPVLIVFDWSEWDEGRKIASAVNFDFNTVDLVTKCKLLTAIVRNDRFCEGALVSAFKAGLILEILKSIENEVKSGCE